MRLRRVGSLAFWLVAGIVAVSRRLRSATVRRIPRPDAPVADPDTRRSRLPGHQRSERRRRGYDRQRRQRDDLGDDTFVGDLTFRLQPPSGNEPDALINRPGRAGGATASEVTTNLISSTTISTTTRRRTGLPAEEPGHGRGHRNHRCHPGCPDNYIPAPDAADTPLPGEGANLAQWSGQNNSSAPGRSARGLGGGRHRPAHLLEHHFHRHDAVELQSFSVD